MYPKLLEYENITIYTYAFCIVLGTLLAVLYTKWQTKKTLNLVLPNTFFYLIFITGFLGGKLFLFFEKPIYYLQSPKSIFNIFSGGFVFYGSFTCIIVFIIGYLRKHKIAILPLIDILAITTTIVHAIGRMGCFFAGCCYGKPTNSIFGVHFPNTHSVAVHPTQLYEVGSILIIMSLLFVIRKNKSFDGQVFISYVILYAIARTVLEIFRGDQRGYIIQNYISHSQFIAFIFISITTYLYIKLKSKKITL
ncbi:prolipoprotein diacylglyceryl transferase [Polaribacter sp. MSW13]|uniref:Phosphatidylglycerol--prolipoprotein diacylglyceryl transferase n=1 Tax=Polaribacter marinus TaxID=2916838 RepID=A0A9X2AKJ7_9FLAO|nr:prolipoprotein diacylglyceryl transferase [Polaribacter marinus]MCI2228315.1 prolipoprotein diacylglyceryl transferase [Polaribacter marinus]